MNQVFLLRYPRENVNRLKLQKSIPLPVIQADTKIRNVGLCDHCGVYLLLKVNVVEVVPTLDALPRFQNLTESEFFRLVGSSKETAIAGVELVSPSVKYYPPQFADFPKYDGDCLLTETNSIVCQRWLDVEPLQRQAPPPKPSLQGVLSGAFHDCQ